MVPPSAPGEKETPTKKCPETKHLTPSDRLCGFVAPPLRLSQSTVSLGALGSRVSGLSCTVCERVCDAPRRKIIVGYLRGGRHNG